MSVEIEQFEVWRQLPDWNEKLITYTGKLSLSELSSHILIIETHLERDKNAPNSMWIVYHILIDRALMNIAMNLQNQQHNFNHPTPGSGQAK